VSISKIHFIQAPEVQDYNPCYSRSRDQEDHVPKPEWANSSQDPVSKTPITKKRASGMTQGLGAKLEPQYCNNNKKSMVSTYVNVTMKPPCMTIIWLTNKTVTKQCIKLYLLSWAFQNIFHRQQSKNFKGQSCYLSLLFLKKKYFHSL
jgi:hypothetical protein